MYVYYIKMLLPESRTASLKSSLVHPLIQKMIEDQNAITNWKTRDKIKWENIDPLSCCHLQQCFPLYPLACVGNGSCRKSRVNGALSYPPCTPPIHPPAPPTSNSLTRLPTTFFVHKLQKPNTTQVLVVTGKDNASYVYQPPLLTC